jgi:DNA-binding transcriptional LysR family regulator
MPVHAVERDIAEGALVALSIEDDPRNGVIVPMTAIYPTSAPPGPAGRWFIERLRRYARTTGAPI